MEELTANDNTFIVLLKKVYLPTSNIVKISRDFNTHFCIYILTYIYIFMIRFIYIYWERDRQRELVSQNQIDTLLE